MSGERRTITDIISSADDRNKAQIEENIDDLIEQLASQDTIHQVFFGSSYVEESMRKLRIKKGALK
jgi:hypothetical protein